jgi:hypothetical protein
MNFGLVLAGLWQGATFHVYLCNLCVYDIYFRSFWVLIRVGFGIGKMYFYGRTGWSSTMWDGFKAARHKSSPQNNFR